MKLERLHRLRVQEEEQMEQQLAQAHNSVALEREQMEQLCQEINRATQWGVKHEAIPVHLLQWQGNYLEKLRDEAKVQEHRLELALSALSQVRREWASVRQEREKVERLLERRREEILDQQRRREQHQLDELALLGRGIVGP